VQKEAEHSLRFLSPFLRARGDHLPLPSRRKGAPFPFGTRCSRKWKESRPLAGAPEKAPQGAARKRKGRRMPSHSRGKIGVPRERRTNNRRRGGGKPASSPLEKSHYVSGRAEKGGNILQQKRRLPPFIGKKKNFPFLAAAKKKFSSWVILGKGGRGNPEITLRQKKKRDKPNSRSFSNSGPRGGGKPFSRKRKRNDRSERRKEHLPGS